MKSRLMPAHPFLSLFEDPTQWQVFASGQAEGKLTQAEAEDGTSGIRLDYDFHVARQRGAVPVRQ